MVARFGDRVLFRTSGETTRTSKAGHTSALVDLYCLSRTRTMVGTRYSSFSYVAAELGNVPLIEVP